MILSKRWERYIFFEIVKVFFFFLLTFFFLFSLIDYATHMQDFSQSGKVQLLKILSFYGCQFIKRSALLLPLAVLISTIKVLCTLNASRELVAFQASGIKLKKLLRPFFILCFICAIFGWFSAEKALPYALNKLESFDKDEQKEKNKVRPFYVLQLKDQSKLIYQKHDKEKGTYFDVYWIRSFNDIWRIKTLKADPRNPVAEFADHLVRSKDGSLLKTESHEKILMKGLTWQENISKSGKIPIENRKMSQLYKILRHSKDISQRQKSEVLTYLCQRSVMPLLSLLTVIAAAPFCIRYTRSVPLFYIYSTGLFGYVSFFTLIDSCVILGSHNTVNPILAIVAPFVICGMIFSWKYSKICKGN